MIVNSIHIFANKNQFVVKESKGPCSADPNNTGCINRKYNTKNEEYLPNFDSKSLCLTIDWALVHTKNVTTPAKKYPAAPNMLKYHC